MLVNEWILLPSNSSRNSLHPNISKIIQKCAAASSLRESQNEHTMGKAANFIYLVFLSWGTYTSIDRLGNDMGTFSHPDTSWKVSAMLTILDLGVIVSIHFSKNHVHITITDECLPGVIHQENIQTH